MLRTGVRWPPGRVKVGDAKFVRLGKVYLIRYKDCHNVKVFSQGPLKFDLCLIFSRMWKRLETFYVNLSSVLRVITLSWRGKKDTFSKVTLNLFSK